MFSCSRVLVLGLILASCNSEPPPFPVEPADGILHVSTATLGGDLDRDGFQLTIDGVPSIALPPTGSLDLTLSAGRHALSLLGVAEQCSVDPGTRLDVDIRPGETIRAALVINCSPVGATLTIRTTGVQLDPDGYRVAVDGVDGSVVSTFASVFTHIDPGSHTITLTGLAPNCAIDGPSSQTVTVVADEVMPIAFDVTCMPTTALIRVTAPTTGPLPNVRYYVETCGYDMSCYDSWTLGELAPNDTLMAQVIPSSQGETTLEIAGIPPNCVAQEPIVEVSIKPGDTLAVAFPVACGP